MTRAACFAIVVLIALHAMAEDKPFEVDVKKAEDHVAVVAKDSSVTLTVKSPSGIGGATIKSKEGKWPDKVVLRLRLKGLESLTIDNGPVNSKRGVKLSGSVLSHSGNKRHLSVVEDGKEKTVEKESPYWTEIGGFDSNDKPVDGLPPSGGYFEITVPKALLDKHPKSLEVEWIDFYRE